MLIGRRESGVDIRQYGSGKMGMANVLRTAGKRAAVVVGILDLMKGAAAVIIVQLIVGQTQVMMGSLPIGILTAQIIAALAAMVGHIYPVFVKFKGGKGVVTFFGGPAAIIR